MQGIFEPSNIVVAGLFPLCSSSTLPRFQMFAKGQRQQIVPDGFGHRNQDDGYHTQKLVEHQATTAAPNHIGTRFSLLVSLITLETSKMSRNLM